MREASSFEQVFERHVDPVYGLFYTFVGNREDAEELTTETFLRIARHLDHPRPVESIDTWILRTVRRVLADHWQRYYRDSALLGLDEDRWEDTGGQGELLLPGSQAAQLVKSTLEGLPDHHRRILELRFLHGSAVVDTARELGVTPEHALVLQRRALAEALRAVEWSDARDGTASSRG
jgi:RNA polymerase sigma-70 factor, ECF subfamily